MTTPSVEKVLIELSEKATPGPWQSRDDFIRSDAENGATAIVNRGSGWVAIVPAWAESSPGTDRPIPQIEADATLIATTRNLIPELTAVVAAARAYVAAELAWKAGDSITKADKAWDALRDALEALDKAGAA